MNAERLQRRFTGVLVVALVLLAGCAGGLQSAGGAGDSGAAPSYEDAAASSGGGGGVGSYYSESGERVLVREADVRLRVDDFETSFRKLRGVADAHGGYVGDRSQHSDGEWDSGQITVRVPAENFSAARDAITELGHVEDENVRVLDFSTQYQNTDRRIEQLEADERELERLLANTSDSEQALEVRQELERVRNQLRELRAQQASLEQREAMSTIRVDMHEPESRKPPKNFESSFGFTDAFLSAFYGGLTAVKWVIVFFGYAIPIGIALVGLGAFGSVLFLTWQRIFGYIRGVFDGEGSVRPGGGEPTTDDSEASDDEP
ncbi:DUF4349 domain-containing protein [Haloarculaceae archaeon H-GB11]|nr:DUF4349 domain-containing protein [Haloarculaceae archaeon H-GB11]